MGRCRGHPILVLRHLPRSRVKRRREKSADFNTPAWLCRGSPDGSAWRVWSKPSRFCPCIRKRLLRYGKLGRSARVKDPGHQSMPSKVQHLGFPYLGQYMPVDQIRIPAFPDPLYLGNTVPLSVFGPSLPCDDPTRGSPPTVVPEAGAVLQHRMQGHTSFIKNPFQTYRAIID